MLLDLSSDTSSLMDLILTVCLQLFTIDVVSTALRQKNCLFS